MDDETKQHFLTEAKDAARKAVQLAVHAEAAARTIDRHVKAVPLAAAGALWADIARTYTTLASVVPDVPTTTEA